VCAKISKVLHRNGEEAKKSYHFLGFLQGSLHSSTLPPAPSSKTSYTQEELIAYLQTTADSIIESDADSSIIIAGDFNQLPDADLQSMGFMSAANEPTHKGHHLDRVYTSRLLYNNCKTV